jgi:probable rRNA maturation factor
MDELRPPQPGGGHGEQRAQDPEASDMLLGDVVICPQVAAAQAAEADHDVQDEIDLLCTHGILHLLGYDHAEPEEHATMFGLQDRLLAAWRSGRPVTSDGGPPEDATEGSG